MREGDLYVQDHGNHVRDDDESDTNRPCRQCDPDKKVAEEVPVAAHEENFDMSCPPCCA